MSGVEQHSSVAYRPQSNGRAERAVQSIVNSLRQYLEQRGGSSKHSWVESLTLALWALNDLPGAVSGYSPHRLVFGRHPCKGIVCPYPYRMGLRMQDNFLVLCWMNVLTSESALKTSMSRRLPNFWPNIRSNPSSRGTVYGYVIPRT